VCSKLELPWPSQALDFEVDLSSRGARETKKIRKKNSKGERRTRGEGARQ